MISVIIPTYNRTRLLVERAIPSVLAQTNRDWELLIVGDGTEDQTWDAITDLSAAFGFDFRFWNLAHDRYPDDHSQAWGLHGLTALNYGLDWARGDWISVLNDDDEYTPDNFEVLLAEAERTGADFIYGMSDTWKNGVRTEQLYGRLPPGDGSITQGSYLYRRSLEYRYRHDCHSRGRNGDADMWIRMHEAGVTFSFLPRIVHHYHRSWP
jgi:glycosyltransferase involved in cell wall biosynthesis